MDSREILATNIRSLMLQAGIKSQSQLAALSGVSQSQVGNILNRKKAASVDTLQRLARGLECDLWVLLAPVKMLQDFEYSDFSPLVHCYMRLPVSDQTAVWEMTHQLYESRNGIGFSIE